MPELEPWGLSGPEFLRLYWIALAAVVVVVVATAIRIRRPRPFTPLHLGVYDLAILTAGPLRVEETAMAGLLSTRRARVNRDGHVTPVHGAPPPPDPVQAYVLDAIPHRRPGRTLGLGASPLGRKMIDTLADHGYLTSYHRARRLRRVHWLFLALLAVCALRAAAFLEVDTFDDTISEAIAATLIAWFVFRLVVGRARSRITAPGREALRRARAQTPPTATNAVLPLVALYGVSAYPNPDLAQVMTLTPQTTTSGSGCGTGCGSGSSDGSGSDSGSDGGSGCGGGCGGGGD